MLNKISLENFKAFNKLENLEVKPITILCGSNSCGKSSILNSILLFKQALESKNSNQTILLNGRLVHLGNFDNLIYDRNHNNDIRLEYEFKITGNEKFYKVKKRASIKFMLQDLIATENLRNRTAEYIIRYNIILASKPKPKIEGYTNQIIVKYLGLTLESKVNEKIIPESKVEILLQDMERELYEYKWENIKTRFSDDKDDIKDGSGKDIKVTFINLFPGELEIIFSDSSNKVPYEINYVIRRINSILQNIFESYTYLGPLREEPSRRYIYEDEIVEIGVKGENAAYLYLVEGEDYIDGKYYYTKENDSFYEEVKPLKISEGLSKWLNLMNINDFKPELINGVIYLNLSSGLGTCTRVNIADVGFGVSQIFPILLEGLRMKKGGTLLLEQPEIHLHPNLQMQMADYFISLALSEKNVVVETHSDHIINRLVRRIVEDESYNLKDLIAIYFIKSTPKGSVYEEIKIDEMSGIVNWPDDFFDQTANESEKIIFAGLKKRKRARESKGGVK